MPYLTPPPGWSYQDPNPFTPDGSYGPGWSAFCLLDTDDEGFITGRGSNGLFAARFGRRVSHLENRLADCLRYESAHGRTVIVSCPKGIDVDSLVAQAKRNTPPAHVVRPGDPPVVVHSTTLAAWQAIRADGELKAASLLGHTGHERPEDGMPNEVERYLRDEPAEYGDYIMFGVPDSTATEMVLASYSTGHFVMDENAVYQPGVRLYLDHHRLIRDGLAVRDGLHTAKVHRRLPLAPYLLAAISVTDLDPDGRVAAWTLKAFVERANEAFRSRR